MMVKEVLEERLLRGKKRSAACWTRNAMTPLPSVPNGSEVVNSFVPCWWRSSTVLGYLGK